MNWKTAFVLVACAAALMAQTPPVTVLEIEYDNLVWYYGDVADPNKQATSAAPSPLSATFNRLFKVQLGLADVVAVNGKPAKGLHVDRSIPLLFSNTLRPGQAIADINGWGVTESYVAILDTDGTLIGNITYMGVGGMAAPPGSPTGAALHSWTITGGTGAFLGVRGQASFKSQSAAGRGASMTEDPAYRRMNGGGKRIEILHLIPMTWPEVLTLPTGPAIFHGEDFSPVTAEKPARAGELLVMSVSGLGPVRPKLDPGKPFPAWEAGKEHQVNSPVEVTVNGKAAAVTSAIGWPGMNNVYRVDFRVPDGAAAGMATLGLSVAWVNGPEVKIPVR